MLSVGGGEGRWGVGVYWDEFPFGRVNSWEMDDEDLHNNMNVPNCHGNAQLNRLTQLCFM